MKIPEPLFKILHHLFLDAEIRFTRILHEIIHFMNLLEIKCTSGVDSPVPIKQQVAIKITSHGSQ